MPKNVSTVEGTTVDSLRILIKSEFIGFPEQEPLTLGAEISDEGQKKHQFKAPDRLPTHSFTGVKKHIIPVLKSDPFYQHFQSFPASSTLRIN